MTPDGTVGTGSKGLAAHFTNQVVSDGGRRGVAEQAPDQAASRLRQRGAGARPFQDRAVHPASCHAVGAAGALGLNPRCLGCDRSTRPCVAFARLPAGLVSTVASQPMGAGEVDLHDGRPGCCESWCRWSRSRGRGHRRAGGGRVVAARLFFTRRETSPDLRAVFRRGGREGDVFYRARWSHDKVARSTHGVNCTGGSAPASCSWKVPDDRCTRSVAASVR